MWPIEIIRWMNEKAASNPTSPQPNVQPGGPQEPKVGIPHPGDMIQLDIGTYGEVLKQFATGEFLVIIGRVKLNDAGEVSNTVIVREKPVMHPVYTLEKYV